MRCVKKLPMHLSKLGGKIYRSKLGIFVRGQSPVETDILLELNLKLKMINVTLRFKNFCMDKQRYKFKYFLKVIKIYL